MKRYEVLANSIADGIRSGQIPIGSRLPSLRQIIAQRGVSQSTVFRAYYLLEEWGLIRAEERAGYFVTRGAAVKQVPLHQDMPLADSTKVDISDLVFSVLDAAKHPDIVPLGSAFPSPLLFPSARLLKSLTQGTRALSPWSTVVDLPPGNDHLRRQIALRYVATGMSIPPEEIVVTNGALEALNLCLMAVTRPGDVVAVESPGFYAALQAIERLDLRAVEIPVHPVTGLDLDALAAALDKHSIRACWFMTNFQNPTGVTLSDAKKKSLVELLAARDVPLIEDDVYQEMHFSRDRPLPAKAFHALQFVLEDACTGLSYRMGVRWTLRGSRAAAQTDDDALGQHPCAGGHCGLPGARRVRPASAQAARSDADATCSHGGGFAALPAA